MIKLKIILCSTRPGRKGPAVADWILKITKDSKKFKIDFIDLKEENLPFHNEPEMPALQKYKHQRTKKWSKKINAGEAFIFVHPEYNHGYSAPLKNALDFLFKEWNYKPVAFVSYGGVAGGSRASEMLIPVVTALKMMPLTESLYLPNFGKYFNEEGKFIPGMDSLKAANVMLDELEKWAIGLNKMRTLK
ncbi:NADPH-dependent FMN reductase [Sphingobacteriaceae bacterium]|nr:NADPH-dependent FMN reductase [Sphingobacteriaceae bacterium]